jgi:hypothetical protein
MRVEFLQFKISQELLLQKWSKQGGTVKSGERGVAVGIDSLVNSIPPQLIFSLANFKNYMLIGASPGTYRTSPVAGHMGIHFLIKPIKT